MLAFVLRPSLAFALPSALPNRTLTRRRPSLCSQTRPTASATSRPTLRSRVPMALTWARVLAVPALSTIGLLPPFPSQNPILTAIFLVASVTDWADGFLARRWNVTSPAGAFLDPVADKLLVASALILVCMRFASGGAAAAIGASAIVVLTREVFVSALREWMASAVVGGRDKVQVGWAGKVKTVFQMVALVVLLFVNDASTGFGLVGTAALVLSAVLAVYSAVGYVKAALPTLRGL